MLRNKCNDLCCTRVHIRTLWSFWWPAGTVVKSSGKSVLNTTPSSASLRSPSPSPSLCSSHEVPPSDSGTGSLYNKAGSLSPRFLPLTEQSDYSSAWITHYYLSFLSAVVAPRSRWLIMWGSLSSKRSRLKGKGYRHVWHVWSMWGCSECITLTFNVLSSRKHSRVQHNSRLSPLPSPRYHEVPTEVSALVFLVHL